MLYRVDKAPHDLTGLFAALFTGAGSVSVIVGTKWGHFRRTGFLSGVFVVEPAAKIEGREGYRITPVRPSTEADMQFIYDLAGTPWRPWHNCFNVLRELWKTPR